MEEYVRDHVSDEADSSEVALLEEATVRASRIEMIGGEWLKVEGHILREMPLTVYVNGNELVTILCTPSKLNCLVAGFLHLEGIISSVDEIVLMRVCVDDSLADVRLNRPDVVLPTRRTLTSGCGGGTTLEADWQRLPEVRSTLSIESKQVQLLVRKLLDAGAVYRRSGGVHTSALAKGSDLILIAEDVGRHNTIDKIHGECLLTGIDESTCALLTTGRISSEMLTKAVRMAVPMVVSRSAPTDRAVQIAQAKGITLIGYARGSHLSVYTHPWRISDCPGEF